MHSRKRTILSMKDKCKKIFALVMCIGIIAASVSTCFAAIGDTTGQVNGVDSLIDQYTSDLQDKFGEGPVSSDDVVAYADSSNNIFGLGSTLGTNKGTFFGGFGGGKRVEIANTNFNDVLCLAGQYITAKDVQVGSSAFLAGSEISLSNFYTYGNLFVAGMNVELGSLTNTRTAYVAAKSIEYTGLCDTAKFTANDVVLGGTVLGDISIYANDVTLLDNLVVYGTLNVTAKEKPVVPSTAQIGKLNYTKMVEKDAESVQKVIKVGSTFSAKLRSAIYLSFAMMLCALLLCWLKPIFVENCGVMLKTRPVKIFVTGFVIFICLPIAFVVIFSTIIGIPLALILMGIYIALLVFATVIAGCTLGRMALPKLNKLLASLIGVVVLQFVLQIPYLGTVVWFASAFFSLGVISQLLWQTRLKKQKKVEETTEEQ